MNHLIRSSFILITLLLLSYQGFAASLNQKESLISGQVYSFKSLVLNEEREIYVSLPEGYDHSTHHYPVIYVLDAEFLFDVTNAIVKIRATRNYMPESIIVGIPNNTGKRMAMAMELVNDKGVPFFYADNLGQTDKYLEFFKQDLIPSIAQQFRVNDNRTIIGMSPTFGPVFEAFWSEPDLFKGHIVLAAEIGQRLTSGVTIAEKLVQTISDKKTRNAAIYVGTSSGDMKKRGQKEANLYSEIPEKLAKSANPGIRYTFDIIANEDHYGMSVPGIQRGLETLYSRDTWQIDYRRMWRSDDPAKALHDTYQQLSEHYGFTIIPVEKSFYSIHNITKTAEILNRQQKIEHLISWLKQAVKYYPLSPELHRMLSEAYSQANNVDLAKAASKKATELASRK